ncbi:hypothetical protein BVC80_1815g16 [Macleaya cordata]|uniref:Uncharacterized protein n=1 Tax=Macleaya cordata TaxID=56857 RepID=A0A200QW31_MACCD|nr:hypothetical protein BVC80_1815g16 [Macleaya cordata]
MRSNYEKAIRKICKNLRESEEKLGLPHLTLSWAGKEVVDADVDEDVEFDDWELLQECRRQWNELGIEMESRGVECEQYSKINQDAYDYTSSDYDDYESDYEHDDVESDFLEYCCCSKKDECGSDSVEFGLRDESEFPELGTQQAEISSNKNECGSDAVEFDFGDGSEFPELGTQQAEISSKNNECGSDTVEFDLRDESVFPELGTQEAEISSKKNECESDAVEFDLGDEPVFPKCVTQEGDISSKKKFGSYVDAVKYDLGEESDFMNCGNQQEIFCLRMVKPFSKPRIFLKQNITVPLCLLASKQKIRLNAGWLYPKKKSYLKKKMKTCGEAVAPVDIPVMCGE